MVENVRTVEESVFTSIRTASALVLLLLLTSAPMSAGQGGGQDDCPGIDGSSTEDRAGCPDSDGDGWSDPGADWTVNNGADAFIDEPTQWSDADRDGYGDNAAIGASNIDFWPEDRLRHRPVLLVACDPASHIILLGEKIAFFCKATNPMQNIGVNVQIRWTVTEGITADWTSREVQLQAADAPGSMTIFSVQATGTALGLSSGEIQLFVDDQTLPSASIGLPVLVVDSFEQEGAISLAGDVSEAFRFSWLHASMVDVSRSIKEVTGLHFPVWLVYAALLVMFSIALKKPAIAFRRRIWTYALVPPAPPMIDHRQEPESEKEAPLLESERTYQRTPSRVEVERESISDIDYVPERLRR